MTDDLVAAFGNAALARFARGDISFPQAVLELERAVDLAESVHDLRARDPRRAWGQIEMLNAVTNGVLDRRHSRDLAALIAEFERALLGSTSRHHP